MSLTQAKETLHEIALVDDVTPEIIEASETLLEALETLESQLARHIESAQAAQAQAQVAPSIYRDYVNHLNTMRVSQSGGTIF